MAVAIGLSAVATRARRMRSAASSCPWRTAASAHSAAYHGRHMPLSHSRNCSGGVASSCVACLRETAVQQQQCVEKLAK